MKKMITTVLATLTFFASFAQIDRELVLVEIGTGVTCSYCPSAANGLHDLYTNGDPVAGIEYHNYSPSSDPFSTPGAAIRMAYYGINSYPTAQFDGSYDMHAGGGPADESMYSTYLPKVNARMDIQTSFEIEIFGTNDGNDYDITVKMKKVAAHTGGLLTLYFALTETDIPYSWLEMTTVDYCERTMVPDAYGTAITLTNVGDEIEEELSFTFNNAWVDENCELIAWIQDGSDKEVLHCDAVMLLDLEELPPPPPSFLADFHADVTDLCEPGLVHFYEDCIGEPTQFKWIFEGGNCSDPFAPNPSVYYPEMGSFDVTLIISDGIEDDTAIKAKYITDHGYPEVTFTEVEPLCNEDWDPYTLTTGKPEGGVYTGEYVSDSLYFHPSESGVGKFDLSYTYTDEYGCGASDNQTVTVVNCVGISDNTKHTSIEIYPNPASSEINLESQTVIKSFKMYSITGEEVAKEEVFAKNYQINTSKFHSGIYLLVVETNERIINKRIVIE